MSNGKYQNAAEKLRRMIEGGDIPLGRPMPTEDRLAETLGVNKRTIRRALTELEALQLVSPLRGRKRYPSRALAGNVHRDIGFLAYGHRDDAINPCYQHLFEAMLVEFQDHGETLRKIVIDRDKNKLPLIVKVNPATAYFGVGDIAATVTENLDAPIAFFDGSFGVQRHGPMFHMDARKIVGDALDYLIKSGHRKIGFLYYHERPLYLHYEELKTYFAGITVGLPSVSARVLTLEKEENVAANFPAYIEKNLPAFRELDALLFCSSFMIPKFLAAFDANGLRVPGDLTAVVLGGPILPDECRDRVDAFEHDYSRMARQIRECLNDIMANKRTPLAHYYLDCMNLHKASGPRKERNP